MATSTGFKIHRTQGSGVGPDEILQLAASTQFNLGDMLYLTGGIGTQVGVSNKGSHIFVTMITFPAYLRPQTLNLSTTNGEMALCIPTAPDRAYLESPIAPDSQTPTLYNVACNSNSTATTVLVSAAGSNSDYVGGLIWCNELAQARPITASSNSASIYTFTVAPGFGYVASTGFVNQPLTTGNTVIVVPFAKGSTGVPFAGGSFPWRGLNLQLGASGGQNKIQGFDFGRGVVISSCPILV